MRVRTLVAWAGDTFSYAAGDEVELEDAVAEARVAAGLAEPVHVPAASADRPKARRGGQRAETAARTPRETRGQG